jgi:hypothetical protein
MRYYRLFILLSLAVIATACDEQFLLSNSTNSRLRNTEWIVTEWHANTSSSCSFDSNDYWDHSSNNIILEEMLGLYNSSDDITRLAFYHDNTFALIRTGQVVLRGDYKVYSDEIVLYSYSDRLEFDIVHEQSSTLVLYTRGENSISDVEVVVKRI